jgi:hypothetical protein
MKATVWLRIAAVLVFVHGALHGLAEYFGPPPPPGPQLAAVTAMKLNAFVVEGATRTFWDFYKGFSYLGAITLIVEAIVIWQLGSLAKRNVPGIWPIIATFAFGFIATALTAYKFLIPPPAIMELVIAACLGIAAIGAAKRTASS